MKKFLALSLTVLMLLSFSACGNGNTEKTASDNEQTLSSTQEALPSSSTPEESANVEDELEQETETEPVEETVEEAVSEEPDAEEITEEEKQAALEDAQKLLRIQPFSYYGLIAYLEEFEGHSTAAATHAADTCGADWNEQAVRHAEYYLNTQSFTREDLISQLEFEKYTTEQAVYGVDGAGL